MALIGGLGAGWFHHPGVPSRGFTLKHEPPIRPVSETRKMVLSDDTIQGLKLRLVFWAHDSVIGV